MKDLAKVTQGSAFPVMKGSLAISQPERVVSRVSSDMPNQMVSLNTRRIIYRRKAKLGSIERPPLASR
jgi:hypothetical protein